MHLSTACGPRLCGIKWKIMIIKRQMWVSRCKIASLASFCRQAQYAISIELRKNLTMKERERFYLRKPVAYSDARQFFSNGLVSKSPGSEPRSRFQRGKNVHNKGKTSKKRFTLHNFVICKRGKRASVIQVDRSLLDVMSLRHGNDAGDRKRCMSILLNWPLSSPSFLISIGRLRGSQFIFS